MPLLQTVRFANVLLAGLIAGASFSIWPGFNPARLSGPAYVEMQQNAIRALNVSMPLLGGVCIAVTLGHACLVRAQRSTMIILMAGAVLFIVSGVVTRFENQPINAVAGFCCVIRATIAP